MDTRNGGSSADACSPLINNAELSGHWCVVRMGSCDTQVQVINCMGGKTNKNQILGVIIIDSVLHAPQSFPTTCPGVFSEIALTFPVLTITADEGDRLMNNFGSTIFTISKAIGAGNYVPHSPLGLLTRESRTGTRYSSLAQPLKPTMYKFFAEPNRLLGWAFGLLQPDQTTTNIGLFDISNPSALVQLRVWSYQELKLSNVDWTAGNLVFGQQNISSGNAKYFWIIANFSTYVFWDVTAPESPSFSGASIQRTGEIFVNRAAKTLWQQIHSPTTGQVQGYRYQRAWDISNLTFPRVLGAFALNTQLFEGKQYSIQYPTFDSWGSNLVSFNLGDNGIAFYNYSDPINVKLAAFRDTSPTSCSPNGAAGGPSGAIVPSSQANIWVSCQQREPFPRYLCGQGKTTNHTAWTICEAQHNSALIDFIGYLVLPENVVSSDKCEDGAIVNLFFQRNDNLTN